MASVREYLENMEPGQLEWILEMESRGKPQYNLPTIWLICTVLAGKKPNAGTPKRLFLDFCERFADYRTAPCCFDPSN